MRLYTFSFIICMLSVLVVTGDVVPKQIDDTPEIEILMDKNNAFQNNHLVRRVEDTLNLTCRVIWFNEKFHLSWHLPISSKNSKNRVVYSTNDDSSNLVIQHLQESDSGDYKCEAVSSQNLTTFSSVTVTVKNKKTCNERFFTCLLGNCIQQRFVCDGRPDCKHGEDEAPVNCGHNPCQGKITCEGRCIPMSWCCQPYNDLNCTIKMRPSCCHQITKPYIEHDPGYVTDQQRFSDINFLQTTIYTVIGCAMVFMLIVTILVVAICRVHMKRSLLTRYPPPTVGIGTSLPSRSANIHHHLQSEQHIPLYDLDVYLNRSPGLLVTYNINNGVQFVGHPIDPPPYCEVVASPPREGPPPPYASREDLENEALLLKSPTVNNTSGSSGGGCSSSSMENICSSIPTVSQSSHCSHAAEENISSRNMNGFRNMDSLTEEEQPLNALPSGTESFPPLSSDLSQTNISGV